MLYVYVIQNREAPPEVYSSYFAAATRCQSHLSGIAEKGSLSERYCLVLEELRLEALRQTSTPGLGGVESHPLEIGFQPLSMPTGTDGSPGGITNYTGQMENAGIINSMPVSAPCDYSGWDQFFSLVSSGLGNLDVSTMAIHPSFEGE